MRSDPTRPLRGMFDKRMAAILRNARKEAIERIRDYLRWHPLDVDEIMAILKDVENRYLTQGGQSTIYQFVNTAYNQGAGDVLKDLERARKPTGFTLNINATFTLQDRRAIQTLASLTMNDLQGISSAANPKILNRIVMLDKQGAGITKISRAIYTNYNDLTIAQAERISRTTINRAYNSAAWDRILSYAPYKEWIPTLSDDRTRDSHRKMAGVIIPTDEPFIVPAFRPSPGSKKLVPEAKMMFPGDVSLDADKGQWMNCRCALTGRFIKP